MGLGMPALRHLVASLTGPHAIRTAFCLVIFLGLTLSQVSLSHQPATDAYDLATSGTLAGPYHPRAITPKSSGSFSWAS